MSKQAWQQKISAEKHEFLLALKEKGTFLRYCPKRGFVYELLQVMYGQVARLQMALKNGTLTLLSIEPAGDRIA